MSSTARRLLVAAPTMLDPNFAHSVVFMVEHTPDGALGVVLNRVTDQPLDEVFSRWATVAAPPAVVFEGGPVQWEGALVALGRVATPAAVEATDHWQPLLGPVGSVDLGVSPGDQLFGELVAVRVFTGYAGWAAGQLDGELEAGGWLVLDAEPDDLLTDAPDRLWRRVLRRQGGDLAMAANQPPDPTVN